MGGVTAPFGRVEGPMGRGTVDSCPADPPSEPPSSPVEPHDNADQRSAAADGQHEQPAQVRFLNRP